MANEKRIVDVSTIIANLTAMKRLYDAISLDGIIEALQDAPKVDAVEVVHGRWKKNWHDNNLIGHEYEECSVCGCMISDTEKFWDCNYCPNCGAKMDGDGNG